MRRRLPAGLLLAAAIGLALSLLLWFRQAGLELGFLDALCSRDLDSGCARAERSLLARPLGVPMPLIGVVFYGTLALLALAARLHGTAALALPSVLLAGAGLVVDVGLLSYSLFALGALCTLCGASYLATLAALGFALREWRRQPARPLRAALRARPIAFLTSGLVALVATAALLEARATGLRPGDFRDDPDRALRLAWDSFLEHYRSSPVEAPAVREGVRRGASRPILDAVLYGDFACPHCRRAAKLLTEFTERHRDTVALALAHYPLDSTCNPESDAVHPGACELAFAAEAARLQGAFWPMSDRLFAEHERWTRGISSTDLVALAGELGLDAPRFERDLGSQAVRDELARDLAQAESLGVTGTPTLFLNGRRMPSIPILTFLEELLRAEAEARGTFAEAARQRGTRDRP